jgi:hypothetical protein
VPKRRGGPAEAAIPGHGLENAILGQAGIGGSQVDVVGHQAVHEESEPEPLPIVGESPQEILTVTVVMKDRLALVGTGGSVVNGAGKCEARRSRHLGMRAPGTKAPNN